MIAQPRPGDPPTAGGVVAGPRDETWRRTIHVAAGALGPLAAHLPPQLAAVGFGALVALAGVAEAMRLGSARAHAAFERFAGHLFRPAEATGLSGATTLALGFALAWWLFPPGVAERAILVTAFADPMAATVGTRARRAGGKTWAGSAACAVTAALVLLLTRVPPAAAVAGGLVAALAERAPWRGADNVTLPLLVGAALLLLT